MLLSPTSVFASRHNHEELFESLDDQSVGTRQYIPALAFTFSPDTEDAQRCNVYLSHDQDEELSFTTAYESDMSIDHQQNISATPEKKELYSSNIDRDDEGKKGNFCEQNTTRCFTPEGLRPRTIKTIRAEQFRINSEIGDQVCGCSVETAKKTNASFSSHHSATGNICSSLDEIFDASIQNVKTPRVVASDDMKRIDRYKYDLEAATSPRLRDLNDADGIAHFQRKAGSRARNDEAREVQVRQILPPYNNEENQDQCLGQHNFVLKHFCDKMDEHDSHNSSDDDNDSETSEQSNSKHWCNEWYQYEKYRDDKENFHESNANLNDSHNSYNSRHALFEMNRIHSSQADRFSNEKIDTVYDFSPLEDEALGDKTRPIDGDDPFPVGGADSSLLSNISQNTSTHVDHENYPNRPNCNLLETSILPAVMEVSALSGNTRKAGIDAARKAHGSYPNNFVPYELKIESTRHQRRLNKEALITEVMDRLKDNKTLIRDVMVLNVDTHHCKNIDSEKVRPHILVLMQYVHTTV